MQAPTQHPTEATPRPPPPHGVAVCGRSRPRSSSSWWSSVAPPCCSAARTRRSPTNRHRPTTVAVTPTETSLVESLVWSRVPLGQAVVGVRRDRDMTSADSGFEIASIAAGGPGFVAVGDWVRVGTSSQAEDAAVWTSPDGTDWTRLPPSAEVFGGPGVQHVGDVTARSPGVQIMEDVTAGGPGLVRGRWLLRWTRRGGRGSDRVDVGRRNQLVQDSVQRSCIRVRNPRRTRREFHVDERRDRRRSRTRRSRDRRPVCSCVDLPRRDHLDPRPARP